MGICKIKIKDFFKSKAFKCIAVLLSVALVCSGLLAILNNVLTVSDTERTSRAIKKIYGEDKTYTLIEENKEIENLGIINVVYKIDNPNGSYDLLFKTTGYEGYKNGTITLWVRVLIKENNATIEKTILESYEKQTLMSKLSDDYYNSFEYGKDYSKENRIIVSGATYSSNAVNNAINSVNNYVMEVLTNEN